MLTAMLFSVGMTWPLVVTAFFPGQEESTAKVTKPEPKPAPAIPPKKVMKVTAYCPCARCCGKYADGKTSIGKDASTPGVAADPRLLAYGTRLDIPGIGILAVDDTGGAMRQSAKKGIWHIDVRFPTHQEALQWGVKTIPVEILD